MNLSSITQAIPVVIHFSQPQSFIFLHLFLLEQRSQHDLQGPTSTFLAGINFLILTLQDFLKLLGILITIKLIHFLLQNQLFGHSMPCLGSSHF